MSIAAESGHDFGAWVAHKRKRRINNWLLVLGGLALLGWCFWDTIMVDTDWERMGGALGIGGTLARFFQIDWSLLPKLFVPALETLMMATLGTILGCFLTLPNDWIV